MKAKFLFSALLMISVLGLKAQDETVNGNLTVKGKTILSVGISSFITGSDDPAVYRSLGLSGLSAPFDVAGNLVLQSRSSSPRGIYFVTGTVPTTRMVLSSSGKLGIGIDAPTVSLDVSGSGKFTGYLEIGTTGSARALRINSVEPLIDLRSGGDVNKRLYVKVNTISNEAIYNTTLLRHYFNTDVQANGLLTVRAGDVNTTSLTSNSGDLTLAAGTDDLWLKTGGSGSEAIGFVDNAGNIKALIDMETGRFGIGETNPGAKLQVQGNTAFNGGAYGSADMTLRATNSSYGFIIKGNSNRMFSVLDNSDNDQFMVGSNGHVGIGTGDPSEALDVVGNIEINGTSEFTGKMTVDNDIITKKLRVTANPTAVPDYVFQPGYNLKSLAEVEAYIKANSHLPGIASATEIGANGQDVGALQLNLLEKIEELTLYTIDQEKKIETQNVENKELKAKNKVLEDTLSELLKRVEQLENKDKTSNDQ
ncbi:MAG: hypothetical protein HEP71_34615 [Roseivirga sp.]|nr:hypothetical protein [Roseivirga sp.]